MSIYKRGTRGAYWKAKPKEMVNRFDYRVNDIINARKEALEEVRRVIKAWDDMIQGKAFPELNHFCMMKPEAFALIPENSIQDQLVYIIQGLHTDRHQWTINYIRSCEVSLGTVKERIVTYSLSENAQISTLVTTADQCISQFYLEKTKNSISALKLGLRQQIYHSIDVQSTKLIECGMWKEAYDELQAVQGDYRSGEYRPSLYRKMGILYFAGKAVEKNEYLGRYYFARAAGRDKLCIIYTLLCMEKGMYGSDTALAEDSGYQYMKVQLSQRHDTIWNDDTKHYYDGEFNSLMRQDL